MGNVLNEENEDAVEAFQPLSTSERLKSGKNFLQSFLIAFLGTVFFFTVLTFLSSKASGFIGFWILHYLIPAFMAGYLLNFALNALINRFRKSPVS